MNSTPTGLWGAVLRRMDEDLERLGWDGPARLFAFSAPGFARLQSERRPNAVYIASDPALPGPFVPYPGTELCAFGDKPREELRGVVAPEWAAALVLTLEAWGSVRTDVLPMSDPEAGELRLLLAVTRSGEEWSFLHARDGATGWSDDSPIDGVLPATLRRVMRLPLTPAQSRRAMTVRQYLGAVAARNVREQMDALYGEVQDLPDGARSPLALLREVVTEDAGQADDVVRDWVNAQLALRTTLAVGWAALGRGETSRDVDGAPIATLFAPPSPTQDIGNDEAVALTGAMAAATAGLTWQGVAGTHSGREFLPPDLLKQLTWCGDDLIGLEIGTNVAADVATELHCIADRAGVEIARYLHHLLEKLGWAPDCSGRRKDAA